MAEGTLNTLVNVYETFTWRRIIAASFSGVRLHLETGDRRLEIGFANHDSPLIERFLLSATSCDGDADCVVLQRGVFGRKCRLAFACREVVDAEQHLAC